MGEPPAVIHRRSAEDLVDSLERICEMYRFCDCSEPEWLESIEGARGFSCDCGVSQRAAGSSSWSEPS